MRRSVAAELLVLRKRTATWILLVLWMLLAGLFSYLVPYIQDAPQKGLASCASSDKGPAAPVVSAVTECDRHAAEG